MTSLIVSPLAQRVARASTLIAAIALAALVATPAQAQIGSRLKKLGKDMVKDAAKNAASGTARDSSQSAKGGATGTAASGSGKVDITVTSDRITMVLAAMVPAAEQAKVAAAAKADRATYEPKRDAAVACVQNATKANTMPAQSNMVAAQKLTAKQEAMSGRYSAALTSGDRRKIAYLKDSLDVSTHLMMTTMFGVVGKCGARPYAPTSLLELEAVATDDGSAANTLTVSDPARTAMTAYQFGMVRERLALYAMGEAGLVSATQLGKEGIFTDDELEALKARRDELLKLAPLFKGGTLVWSGSSDLRGW